MLRIRKTKIESKQEIMAMTVAKLIDRGKKIKNPILKKEEEVLFMAYMHQRQSMKRAVAYEKWKKFINQHIAE